MQGSKALRLLLFSLFLIVSNNAKAGLITVLDVSGSGFATAISGQGYDDWNTVQFDSYAASASADGHSASASAMLSFMDGNVLQLSGSASATAAFNLTGFTTTSAFSHSIVDFSTDVPAIFTLTGSQSDAFLFELSGDSFVGFLTLGESRTLDPGTFQLKGSARASDTRIDNPPQFEDYSGTLTLTTVPPLGDFDGDFDVDGIDFLEWQRSDGTPEGLAAWESNFGTSPSLLAATSTAVPEPNTVVLALLAVTLCAMSRSNLI